MIKWILFVFCIIEIAYDFILMYIANVQRKKKLPEEVADVYDANQYKTFMEYKKDQRELSFLEKTSSLLVDMVILFTPFFIYMESWFGKNPYRLFVGSFLILTGVNAIFDFGFEWISTFKIEEKYGKNKKTFQEFLKDFLIENGLNIVTSLGLFLPIIYVCEHLVDWTHNFSISYSQSFLLALGLLILFGLILLVFAILSIVALKKQYTFKELEEGELRSKIIDLMKDSKKKVKKIEVYNESKKSNSKNAFVLKLLWFRQIGIADNFLLKNSQRELLGVLAHEVGHLKHKRNILNYMLYGLGICIFLLIVVLIPHGGLFIDFSARIRMAFGLHQSAYYVYFLVYSMFLGPIMYFIGLFKMYATRVEEFEADQNAVKEGYGEDLITLFKEISKDELIDVNPSIWIERLTYDHPGMYRRICAIRKGNKNEF